MDVKGKIPVRSFEQDDRLLTTRFGVRGVPWLRWSPLSGSSDVGGGVDSQIPDGDPFGDEDESSGGGEGAVGGGSQQPDPAEDLEAIRVRLIDELASMPPEEYRAAIRRVLRLEAFYREVILLMDARGVPRSYFARDAIRKVREMYDVRRDLERISPEVANQRGMGYVWALIGVGAALLLSVTPQFMGGLGLEGWVAGEEERASGVARVLSVQDCLGSTDPVTCMESIRSVESGESGSIKGIHWFGYTALGTALVLGGAWMYMRVRDQHEYIYQRRREQRMEEKAEAQRRRLEKAKQEIAKRKAEGVWKGETPKELAAAKPSAFRPT